MSPHHALPSANVIDNPPPVFDGDGSDNTLSAATTAAVTATTTTSTSTSAHVGDSVSASGGVSGVVAEHAVHVTAASLPLIPPFRIPWKVSTRTTSNTVLHIRWISSCDVM